MVNLASWQATLVGWWQRLYTSDFVQKVVETFGTRLALIAIGLVTGVIVTRTLGPEGRGFYATAVTIGAIGVQFGNLGLHASNTYYVAQDRSRLAALVGNSVLVSLAVGGAVVALAGSFFIVWPQVAPLHGPLLMLALLWIPLGLLYLLLQNLLLGIQEVRAYNLTELGARLLTVGLLVLVIVSGVITPERVFTVSLVTMIVGVALVGWRLRGQLAGPVKGSWELFRQGMRYGFKSYLAAFFAYLVLRVDLLMVKQMLGAEPAGYYSLAANMAELVGLLPVSIGVLLFPKLAAMPDEPARWRYARKTALIVGAVMIVLVVLAALCVRPVVSLLYGVAFLPAAPAFVWLTPAIVTLAVNTILMNYFAAGGMPLVTVYSPGLAAVVNIVLNWWWLPQMGIVGASLSSVVAYTLMLLMSVLHLYWQSRRVSLAGVGKE
jgi:O-antigen/teichoic acid export membrane protein